MNNYHTKPTSSERDLLAIWKAQGLSNIECGRRLGRDKLTIGRELKRNGYFDRDGLWHYVAIHAAEEARRREERSNAGKQALKNPEVFDYVTKHLRKGWSPDQIAGRLKRKHSTDKHFWITPETVYRWIYKHDQVSDHWYEYLRRKQTKRRHYQGRKVHRGRIPDRVSIHDREEKINNRSEFGHWEGDTVEGKGRKVGLHTEVERISRFIMASKVEAVESQETIKVQTNMFQKLPQKARKSTTLDNGRENHLHMKLRDLEMKTFFADPYSSWQRGTNENGNWHIRYYFPKGTDFNTVSEEELQDAVEEINARPRKIHGYLTAKEVFNQLINLGVAIAN